MRLIGAMAMAILVVSSCKTAKTSSEVASANLREPAAAGHSSDFCRLDFGMTFYGEFVELSSEGKLRQAFPLTYQDMKKKLTSQWRVGCNAVHEKNEARAFVTESVSSCEQSVADFDASAVFKDLWFESARIERAKQLKSEMTMICGRAGTRINESLDQGGVSF